MGVATSSDLTDNTTSQQEWVKAQISAQVAELKQYAETQVSNRCATTNACLDSGVATQAYTLGQIKALQQNIDQRINDEVSGLRGYVDGRYSEGTRYADGVGSKANLYSDGKYAMATRYADDINTGVRSYADGIWTNAQALAASKYSDATKYADGIWTNAQALAASKYSDATKYADDINTGVRTLVESRYSDATKYADGVDSRSQLYADGKYAMATKYSDDIWGNTQALVNTKNSDVLIAANAYTDNAGANILTNAKSYVDNAMGMWKSYTLKIGARTTAPTLGAPANTVMSNASYLISGKICYVTIDFRYVGSSTGIVTDSGAGTYVFSLPPVALDLTRANQLIYNAAYPNADANQQYGTALVSAICGTTIYRATGSIALGPNPLNATDPTANYFMIIVNSGPNTTASVSGTYYQLKKDCTTSYGANFWLPIL
jgi:hypothetical protein